jgi:hypothetical protein
MQESLAGEGPFRSATGSSSPLRPIHAHPLQVLHLHTLLFFSCVHQACWHMAVVPTSMLRQKTHFSPGVRDQTGQQSKNPSPSLSLAFVLFFFFFLAVLGFALRASFLLVKTHLLEDPRWRLGCRSRQHELCESKTLLRHCSHTWQK